MRTEKIKRAVILIATLLLASFQSSCVKEDNSNCPVPISREITIKVEDIYGNDITDKSEVHSADLFLFGKNGEFVEKISVNESQIVDRTPIRVEGDVTVVAWGNTSNTERMDGAKFDVAQLVLEKSGEHRSTPDDIFFGIKDYVGLTATKKAWSDEIVVRRKTGKIHVEVRGMEDGISAEDYALIAKQSYKGFGFDGTPVKEQTTLFERLEKNNNNHLVTPRAFNVLHTVDGADDAMEIRLVDKQGNTLATATQDTGGKQIKPIAGKTTNVLIEFSEAGFTISIETTDWDEIFQWVEQ